MKKFTEEEVEKLLKESQKMADEKRMIGHPGEAIIPYITQPNLSASISTSTSKSEGPNKKPSETSNISNFDPNILINSRNFHKYYWIIIILFWISFLFYLIFELI